MPDEQVGWSPVVKALEARIVELESARQAQQRTLENVVPRLVELEKLAEQVKKALPAEAPRRTKWF